MMDRDEMDMLAAEYVLGTLDPAQRQSVAARRLAEPDLDALIADWEKRLSPLNSEYVAVPPSPNLFAHIRRKIEETGKRAGDGIDNIVQITMLKRKLAMWRAAAIGAGAIAASLVITVFASNSVYPPQQDRQFVAVFHRDDTQPAFVMSVDMDSQEVTIRPIDASTPVGKTYQLWIVTDQTGPQPKSLGLLENIASPTVKQLGQFDPAMLRNATFGISLEPEGGSPTGLPTGPAIHGRLISIEH
ncbi:MULTISPECIES: anti-sigma factor [Thalassospira]|uniref:Anti-sigma K factor RskA C-terminal domain-containing protein n=2 Tax=Thalassospira TaxID=168934 RepID=A0A367VZN2_9PROT|nr:MULTISPECIES: anti-sigma factor [Thalassospira]MDG4720322.1 anti-sigma factor [Thalassospira sp. FZY0004]RCK32184.1 hypothetical protein TH19_19885 [Thalassospira profundimaris]